MLVYYCIRDEKKNIDREKGKMGCVRTTDDKENFNLCAFGPMMICCNIKHLYYIIIIIIMYNYNNIDTHAYRVHCTVSMYIYIHIYIIRSSFIFESPDICM